MKVKLLKKIRKYLKGKIVYEYNNQQNTSYFIIVDEKGKSIHRSYTITDLLDHLVIKAAGTYTYFSYMKQRSIRSAKKQLEKKLNNSEIVKI